MEEYISGAHQGNLGRQVIGCRVWCSNSEVRSVSLFQWFVTNKHPNFHIPPPPRRRPTAASANQDDSTMMELHHSFHRRNWLNYKFGFQTFLQLCLLKFWTLKSFENLMILYVKDLTLKRLMEISQFIKWIYELFLSLSIGFETESYVLSTWYQSP